MARQKPLIVATGNATGSHPDPVLATQAVESAMRQLAISHASGVLLFLTPHYASNPQPAILAASRTSQCIQVFGSCCVAPFTEHGTFDQGPAAVAMVFSPPISLTSAHSPDHHDAVLTLRSQPYTTTHAMQTGRQFGAIISPPGVRLPLWQNGKLTSSDQMSLYLNGSMGCLSAAQGIRLFSAPLTVTACNGLDLYSLDHQPALESLMRDLPFEARQMEHIPLHLLFAAVIHGNPEGAYLEGRYHLVKLMRSHPNSQSITTSEPLSAGDSLIWCMLSPSAGQRNARVAIDHCHDTLAERAEFGVMFISNAKRVSYYHEQNLEQRLLIGRYPDLPLIGCHSQQEIAALTHCSYQLDYLTVIGLFSSHV